MFCDSQWQCMADMRTCWAMGFVESKSRNRLDEHLETCTLLHQPPGSFQLHDQVTFPYDNAVKKSFPKMKT